MNVFVCDNQLLKEKAFEVTGFLVRMTKEEENPEWVGGQEFYDKYEPKEILGR